MEALHHLGVHLGGTKHRDNRFHLARHRVVHVDLGAATDQVFRHDLGWSMLVLHGKFLDLLHRLGLLVLQLGALAFNLSDGAIQGALVLLGLLLRVDLWLTVSHCASLELFVSRTRTRIVSLVIRVLLKIIRIFNYQS